MMAVVLIRKRIVVDWIMFVMLLEITDHLPMSCNGFALRLFRTTDLRQLQAVQAALTGNNPDDIVNAAIASVKSDPASVLNSGGQPAVAGGVQSVNLDTEVENGYIQQLQPALDLYRHLHLNPATPAPFIEPVTGLFRPGSPFADPQNRRHPQYAHSSKGNTDISRSNKFSQPVTEVQPASTSQQSSPDANNNAADILRMRNLHMPRCTRYDECKTYLMGSLMAAVISQRPDNGQLPLHILHQLQLPLLGRHHMYRNDSTSSLTYRHKQFNKNNSLKTQLPLPPYALSRSTVPASFLGGGAFRLLMPKTQTSTPSTAYTNRIMPPSLHLATHAPADKGHPYLLAQQSPNMHMELPLPATVLHGHILPRPTHRSIFSPWPRHTAVELGDLDSHLF